MYKYHFLGCLLWVLLPGGWSEAAPLTLVEAVDQAVLQHVGLQAKRCTWQQERNKTWVGWVPLLPTFSMGASAHRQATEVPQTWKRTRHWTLHWEANGLLTHSLGYGQQYLGQQVHYLAYQETRQQVIYDTVAAYYALVVAQRKAALLTTAEQTAERVYAWVCAEHALGRVANLDRLEARLTREQARLACLTQDDALGQAQANLQQCLGPVDPTPVDVDTTLPALLPFDETSQAAPASLATQRLRWTAAQAKALQYGVWATLVPTLGLSVGREYPSDQGTATPVAHHLRYGVSLSWNLSKLIGQAAVVQNARLAHYQARRALGAERLGAQGRFVQQKKHVTQLRQQQRLRAQQVEVTQAKQDLVWVQYQRGNRTLTDWAQAHKAALDAQLAALEHRQALFLALVVHQRQLAPLDASLFAA